MKKRYFILLSILILFLYGCTDEKANEYYPEYFIPIVKEIEEHWKDYAHYGGNLIVIDRWWSRGVQTGIYKEKEYTSYIYGETHTFNLENELAESENWDWQTAGAFQTKERTYIALVDFNLMYDDNDVPNPQIILLDFATDNPEDYLVTPYTVEPPRAFCWLECSYILGNNLYIASKENLAAINLQTREFYHCKEENSIVMNYAKEKFGDDYWAFFLRTVFEQDEVLVYSAEVSEADDMPPIGVVFVAYKNMNPIAYMSVDFRSDEMREGIEVKVVE